MVEISGIAQKVITFVNQTQRSIFLTGKAGTGKTTLLSQIVSSTYKRTVVVAPTGIAALNAKGVTVHSMFQLPFSGFIPENLDPSYYGESVRFETKNTLGRHFMMNAMKKNVIIELQLLIVDEVSMLRPDVLDAMDFMLQRVRRNKLPFGGVQVLFIGDLMQLPPVIRNEEWNVLQQYYTGKFFFHAHVIQNNPPIYIELDKIYRQEDPIFINILNNLRNNQITQEDQKVLNSYLNPNFDLENQNGYITLTTHNHKADEINKSAIERLNEPEMHFYAEVVGDFPEKNFPIEEKLTLKKGAQIMFIKNDLNAEKNYFNGKMGIIFSLSKNEILVKFPEENKIIELEKYEWKNIRYVVNENTKEIEEEVLGTFVQFPIKLAWAITVHKSQGLTFDKAVLDVSDVFVPGQLYVALSRLRSLQGMVLLKPIQLNGISSSRDVLDYASQKADEHQIAKSLEMEKVNYIKDYLTKSFSWASFEQLLKNHLYGYEQGQENSTKSNNLSWALTFYDTQKELGVLSIKFMNQLKGILQTEKLDTIFLQKRIHAAFDYFIPLLKEHHLNLLLKIEYIKRTKKAKTYFNELSELDDRLTSLVLELFYAVRFVDCLAENLEINKENLKTEDQKKYKISLQEKALKAYRDQTLTVVPDEEEVGYYIKSKASKKTKEVKKSTYEDTFELWEKKHTLEEIAKIRLLSSTTIESHFAKLIEQKRLKLSDIMNEERIDQMAEAFKDIKAGDSLTDIKNRLGEGFSWGEIKIFKASITEQA
jgi:uncharacterized protein YpbB/GTPase SAR1 family protein